MLAARVTLMNHTVAVPISGQSKVWEGSWKLAKKREEWEKAFQMDAAEQPAHSQGTILRIDVSAMRVGGEE